MPTSLFLRTVRRKFISFFCLEVVFLRINKTACSNTFCIHYILNIAVYITFSIYFPRISYSETMAAVFMTAFFLLFLRYSFCDWKVHFFFFKFLELNIQLGVYLY